jgi:hypothetical protein
MLNRTVPSILVIAALAVLGLSHGRIRAVEDSRKTLAEQDTVAVFDGAQARKCMGMTALCPNDCGHSGTMASFTIKGYVSYQKKGEYGDPKTDRFMFLVEDNKKNPKVSKEIADVVASLKPGDMVCLAWSHDYVTKDGSSFPERPIKQLRKVTPEEAAKLLEKAEKVAPPPEQDGGKPAAQPMAR